MPTVTVNACAGAFCLKSGPPILNAVFNWLEYQGTWPKTKTIPHRLEATGGAPNGVYLVTLPMESADVNVSAPGHGDSTERMTSVGDFSVRI
jgi:hypothetical protein